LLPAYQPRSERQFQQGWMLPCSDRPAPGVGPVDRLARALGTTMTDLLPISASPDTQAALRGKARRLAEALIQAADRETLLMLCPLLARLVESTNRMK
jgi:hypothetical protein